MTDPDPSTAETIDVPCYADSSVARFVGLVNTLPDDLKSNLVLIGGLTVSCRLGFAHRVTNDVDGLYFNTSPNSIEEVLIGHHVNTEGHRVLLEGDTKLDVIEVADFDFDDLPDNVSDRLFIAAHRWAYDTANLVTVNANDPITGTRHASVTIRLARPAALVPMKVRAAENRPRNNEKKKASDSHDAYQLLDTLDRDGDLAAAVADAPWEIADLTAGYVQRLFVDNAEITAGRVNRWMNPAQPISTDQLRRVATRFLSRLQ